jgi:hypothetical protein
MSRLTLTQRVEILEETVAEFASLPSRVAGVELQIVQLRAEIQGGFSAVRQEMAVMRDDLRSELHRELHGIRSELGGIREELGGNRGEFEGIRGQLGGIRGELGGIHGELNGIHGKFDSLRAEIRAEIRAGDEETRRYMRVLYEDLIGRIAALGDTRR